MQSVIACSAKYFTYRPQLYISLKSKESPDLNDILMGNKMFFENQLMTNTMRCCFSCFKNVILILFIIYVISAFLTISLRRNASQRWRSMLLDPNDCIDIFSKLFFKTVSETLLTIMSSFTISFNIFCVRIAIC